MMIRGQVEVGRGAGVVGVGIGAGVAVHGGEVDALFKVAVAGALLIKGKVDKLEQKKELKEQKRSNKKNF
jgi:hypothetical protein